MVSTSKIEEERRIAMKKKMARVDEVALGEAMEKTGANQSSVTAVQLARIDPKASMQVAMNFLSLAGYVWTNLEVARLQWRVIHLMQMSMQIVAVAMV